jgi:hypothetical protein
MPKTRIDLDVHTVFWRIAGLIFFLSLLTDWTSLPRRVRPGRRILFSLFSLPKALIVGLLASAIVTLLAWLAVRLVLRPAIERWHLPPSDGAMEAFHLASNEWVIASIPARRFMGWRWRVGTLVRTNIRLWFFPRFSDADVWSFPLESVGDVALEPAPRVAWGLIRNWPERIAVRLVDDDQEQFAVLEPRAVRAWLEPPTLARKPDPIRS